MIIERWREMNTTINLDLFLEAIDFCMESSYFQYKNQYYKQTYGTAMGSPLSPILADIALDSVIDRALTAIPFLIPIIRKYVDDLFLAIPKDGLPVVLELFNKQEPRLQFTVEVEQDRKLPYLDMTVIRKDNQHLTTEWYSKPIASGRMLNFYSCHQMQQKINVAQNFIHRVMFLSHNSSIQQQNIIIHQHLQNNNYPKTLINRLIQKQLSMMQRKSRTNTTHNSTSPPIPELPEPQSPRNAHPEPSPSPPPQNNSTPSSPPQNNQTPTVPNFALQRRSTRDTEVDPPISTTLQPNQQHNQKHHHSDTQQVKLYRSVPYVPMLTERLSKMLRQDYPLYHIASRQHNTVNQFLSKLKDPVNKLDKHSVVYKIPCSNCNRCYIGMTNNKLNTRLLSHKSNIKRLEEIIDGTHTTTTLDEIREKTALLQHCVDSEHRFKLENTTIIDRSRTVNTLPFLEMCHIYTTPQAVNKRTDIAGLNTAYAALLTSLNSPNTTLSPSRNSPISNNQDNNPNS